MDVEQYLAKQQYARRLSGRIADIMTRSNENLTASYSPNVRLGNWYEDLCLQEEQLKDYLDKREKGTLFIQKKQKLYETILAPTQLTVSVDGFVHFGDHLLVIHPGLSDEQPTKPQTLAAHLGDDPFVHVPSRIPEQAALFAVGNTAPVVRNTFIIKPIGGKPSCGRPLTYGEPFQLSTLPGDGGNLLVYSARVSFQEHAHLSNHQLVKLVKEESRFTHWKVLHPNPGERLETEGSKVPINQKIVLNHIFTNQALALERKYAVKSVLDLEYEVTTKTYLNIHKWESEPNHWLFSLPRKVDDQTVKFPCETNATPLSYMTGLVSVDAADKEREILELASGPVRLDNCNPDTGRHQKPSTPN